MEGEPSSTPTEPSKKDGKSKKLFCIGGHSRTSSCGSIADETEAFVELLPSMKAPKPEEVKGEESYSDGSDGGSEEKSCRKRWCTVSGSCMCKLSIVFYLAACIIISALYVAFFGKNQAFFGEAWIPGKPTVHDKPSPSPLHFEDLEYTEWISHRWTFQDSPFANWPMLPGEIDNVRQIVSGQLGRSGGQWVLTDQQLFFLHSLHGKSPGNVELVNVSQELSLEVTADTYVALEYGYSFYLLSSSNATYLDCSEPRCEVVSSACEDIPFEHVYSSCYSLSDTTFWLGTSHGLFTVRREDHCLSFSNVSQVTEPVRTLAWRSAVTDGVRSRHPTLQPFFFQASVQNHLQEVFASSSPLGTQWTGRYWSDRKEEHGFGVLVVGTRERVYFHDGRSWWHEFISLWKYGWGGLVDGIPTAMTFGPSGELYIANNVSLTRVNINYSFDRIGPREGLPYNQLTSLFVSPHSPQTPPLKGPAPPPSVVGTLWIGTTRGYALLDIQSSKFVGYFNGLRWLPAGEVRSMVGSGSSVMVLTDTGLAIVHPELWTLSSKALHYKKMLKRHIREPGIVGSCSLKNYDLSTCTVSSTSDDALSTSWLVAAEAFRYQATGDARAKASALQLFNGLKFLVNVTGIDGLMAGSAVLEDTTAGMGGAHWHESSTVSGWRWREGSSSASVVGHMWAYPLVHDIITEGEEQQQEVTQLIETIVDYLRTSGYVLLDMGNCSTHWGVWSPSQLNNNQSLAGKKGLNSLQILSFLLSAYRVTGDSRFLHSWKELFSEQGYGRNLINVKSLFPLEGRGSEDQLSFLSYFLYYYSLKQLDRHQLEEVGPAAQEYADLSLQRAWHSVRREKSSAWATIFAYITGVEHDERLLEELVWTLRKWPLELVDWPTSNSHRLDITIDPETSRYRVQSMEVLPPNERSQLCWNSSPFFVDGQGSSREVDPGPWLLPYWMAKWIHLIP